MAKHIPGPLYFEQIGATGTPMIFCHSTPDDHRLWLFQTAHFSSWYRTIAVDLAGYGRSPAPQPGMTIEDLAAACWEAVDRVSSGGAIIHGNSLGARVAQYMAATRPERTLALIVSGCGFSRSSEAMVKWMARYREEGLLLRERQVIEHFAPALQKQPLYQYYARMVTDLNNLGTLDSIIAVNEALSHHYPEELLERIKAPTLIIAGTEDWSYATVGELQKRIKGSELRSIEGAGHGVPIEAPAEYDKHCVAFLTRIGLFPASA